LGEIVSAMQTSESIGAAQCKLRQMDSPGRLESVGHWIDTAGLAHVVGQDEPDEGQYDQGGEVFGATGAAMVVCRTLFEDLGGFDSDFFIFFEESDLCWRIWLRGYRVISVPKAIVFHKGGGTVRRADVAWRVYLFARNRTTSMLKNYSVWSLLRYMPMNVTAMASFSLLFGIRGAGRLAVAVARALLWNLMHARTVWRKRRAVQRTRRISDGELFRRGIIRPFSFSASARDGLYKSSAPRRNSGRYLG
jgi:GT2 family glycosyltransferase